MYMKVIEYIKQNGLYSLNTDFGIKIKEYDDLIILNYDQIDSPKTNEIVKECRSLILYKDYTVASRKFDRFFNYGENNTTIDFLNCEFYTKEDGSLIGIYYNRVMENWEISTKSSAFGEVEHKSGITFRELVLHVLQQTEKQFQQYCSWSLDTRYTYIFELVGPLNRHVTRYERDMLVHIGTRENLTGKYDDSIRVYHVSICRPIEYTVTSLTHLQKIISILDSDDKYNEGLVAYNPFTQERVKIKSTKYLKAFALHMNGNPSVNNIIDIILANEQDEILTYFPEYILYFDPWVEVYKSFMNRLEYVWSRVKDISDKKEFALEVKDLIGNSVYFRAKSHNEDVHTAFNSLLMTTKIDMIKKYREEYDRRYLK